MRRFLVAALLVACSKDPAPPASGSGTNYEALGKKPTNARRPTAPPDIEKNALAVGAKAPDLALTDATGAKWTLADALTKHKRVMLVFYRGDW
jgi:hypothetical protein